MRTKALVLVFVLCVFFLKHKGQTYFNNRYDNFGGSDAATIIDTFNNYYLTAGFTCPFNTFRKLNLKLYNKITGNEIISKTYQRGTNDFGNANYTIKSKNKFSLCGTRSINNPDTSLVFLWQFDASLDSIKYNEYGYLNKRNEIYKMAYDNNKYYYMIGQVSDNLYNSDILLVKVDTIGNEIWKKKIGITGMDEAALSIDTLKGDLIISGLRIVHNTSTTDAFVMRLDTAGNILWQKNINTNGGYSGSKILTLNDGNILVYNRYKEYTSGSYEYYRLQVQKITPNNVLIWQKKYNRASFYADPSGSIIENTQGHLVMAGQKGFVGNSIIMGTVNVLSQNGDSLFYKEFYKEQGSQNYFRDVIQTPDKGYCFAGFIIPVVANGGTGTEDIWLLKVDSNFCESAIPCNNNVSVKELVNDANWKVYPNPASEYLEVSCLSAEPYSIEITNALGQVVLTPLSFGEGLGVRSINVQHFISGMYYLSIKTKDKTVTTKFIKE